jgi:hypothetical protein
MKNIKLIIIALNVFFFTETYLYGQNAFGNDMMNLTQIKDGIRNRRISSHDTTGNNYDMVQSIKSGQKITLADIKGAGIINHIWITMGVNFHEFSRSDIIIRFYWDGNDFPSVESPIGPFFGQGWDEYYDYISAPLAATPQNGRTLVSYFAMPFSDGARIEIENQCDSTLGFIYYYVDYQEMDRLPNKTGRFHAWYNHELTEALPQGEIEWGLVGPYNENPDGKDNYLFAHINGKGHFVGVNYYVNNPSPMWYGEGDDMWFIDGEKFPSMIGTGTEDFFNTSFGAPDKPFYHPFFGYPKVAGNMGFMGRTHLYRFFINDPIYFDKELKATIEHGHGNNMTLDLSSVSYWYQDKASPIPPIPNREERKFMPANRMEEIHKWRHEWRKSKGSDPKLWGNE